MTTVTSVTKTAAPVVANKITWVKSATKLPFLRVATVLSHTRSGKIASRDGQEVYGYEVLPDDAVRSNGKFARKIYYIFEEDRSLAVTPMGAVYADELSGRGRKSVVKSSSK